MSGVDPSMPLLLESLLRETNAALHQSGVRMQLGGPVWPEPDLTARPGRGRGDGGGWSLNGQTRGGGGWTGRQKNRRGGDSTTSQDAQDQGQ